MEEKRLPGDSLFDTKKETKKSRARSVGLLSAEPHEPDTFDSMNKLTLGVEWERGTTLVASEIN